ncbi:MAG: DNA-binding response regulator [Thermobacillus sp.]|uniref:Response regulator with CheY-like receiver domain and winged-helix DNA-binding domain n=2 Tax=Thermobacillus TaxID=76632 RepID=L0EGK7_THECK|nr:MULTISPECIES: response regulator transcription factor [Thermobacillus]AGA58779.1 response regulator with CheY-like receiver domain and winged-helix DNA-binding domain [Thermobacillus composti KWC4]REJ12728.1 MAG: DNA-binding response regulator [Paenibacillaceae bacterium]REK54083.1 MAG: DNA-binding response regulator [Thermobacillus sp.]CAG5091844.1 Alkaline phosphatase synthesis transcriptional regulatory protein PhoP [Thermobacillus xylanilyticus]
MRRRILVVDDEPSIAALLEYNLQLAGYDVRCVSDGEAVFDALGPFRPDLIVLDRMLPRMDGLEVCRRLRREKNEVPVIMLTALHDVSDRIAGLAGGADDYMTKPFSPQELIARIGAIFRRTGEPARTESEGVHRIGRLTVRADAREVELDGRPVELTPKEFDLLLFMCRRRGKVLSRRQILHGVWDCPIVGDTRIVDVHISHLRDKIEKNARSPEYIMTVRSVGYKLTGPPDEPTA